jgi:hypothetical protein
MPEFSHEIIHRIYDDSTGDYLEIGPDMDALELIEIRAYTMNPVDKVPYVVQRIVIHPKSLDLVIAALTALKTKG